VNQAFSSAFGIPERIMEQHLLQVQTLIFNFLYIFNLMV